MRQRKTRINGPYEHGKQWRVVIIPPDGSRGYRCFDSESEARAYVRDARCAAANRTVGQAVTEYLEHLRTYGGSKRNTPLRESSVRTAQYRLLSFFRLRESDMALADLDERAVADFYLRRTRTVRADTHRGELTTAWQFLEHEVRLGNLDSNPASGVKPRGELSTGKNTLSTDEARTFLRVALDEGSTDGLACAVTLVFALRASELAGLLCRDLDAGGTILRVQNNAARRLKTRASERSIAVPPEFQPLLQRLRGDRPGDAQLFPGMTRYRLHYQVGRICSIAGVRRVCPHGLRGSASTEAAEGSLTVAQRLLGHEPGSRVTERAYIRPGTLESAATRRRAEELFARNFLGTAANPTFPPSDEPEVN